MTLEYALNNFEVFEVIKKYKNKKGKIEEYSLEKEEISALNPLTDGKIGIRDMRADTFLPAVERLVFVIKGE